MFCIIKPHLKSFRFYTYRFCNHNSEQVLRGNPFPSGTVKVDEKFDVILNLTVLHLNSRSLEVSFNFRDLFNSDVLLNSQVDVEGIFPIS